MPASTRARDTSAARGELAFEREVLRDSAAALAETVASEPERIAAAVAAEADRIYRAATAGLDDYLAADAKLLDALGRGEVIDEYHPLILARMRRLDYLRDLLAPVTQ